MKAEAYRCTWHSTGWTQYHDKADPMPDEWDSPPDEVAALVLKIEAEAEIQRLTAERDALRARIEDAPVGIINSPCLNNSPTWSVSGPYTKSLNGKRVALVVLEGGE